MDALSILAAAKACASNAPALVVAAVALVQTKAEPFAVGVSGEIATHATFDKAVKAAATAETNKEFVQIGVALVPLQELRKRKISLTDGFSSCHNLKVAGELIAAERQQIGGKDSDWTRAAIAYGVGHPDAGEVNNFADTYKKRYDELKALEPQTLAVTPPPRKV